MDLSFNQFFDPSNHIWHKIMDQLAELREWQRIQEEVIRNRQSKQIDSLTQQNIKLNALSTDDKDTNSCTDEFPTNQCHHITEPIYNQLSNPDSHTMEDIRTEEECHQISDNQSFLNTSYLETCPVTPGINGKDIKTFEQFLDIKLKDKNIDLMANNENKPKKPFLRKGEGIKRFEGNKSQTDLSSKDNQKSFCNKTNETKSLSNKSRPKIQFSVKQFVNKRKVNKNETDLKPKQFIRKVIPMTTKFEKIDKKSVEISRNTPTVLMDSLNETESEILNYLRQIYENVSVEDISIDDNFKNKDIHELQDLLKKIEMKKEVIEKQFDGNPFKSQIRFCDESERFVAKSSGNCKKKVHWSHIQTSSDDESDEKSINDLIEPKPGAYSSKLKQQIHELEDQLSRLKNTKKDKLIDSSVLKSKENIEPISEELTKLRQQIEKLSERIVSIESKAYDLSAKQKDLSNNKKSCFVAANRKTFSKVICPPTTGPNVLVNEMSNETTIDFPNGDKMTVSKDNTILYSFANGTTQTTYPDGFKITHFPNGQMEKVDRNGVKRITYSNGLQRIINPDSSEEVIMTDGTVWRIYSDGSEVLEFANGDREIRTNKYKRREYRNGNIKTLYSDGTEETRYISGRLRIKDMFGNLTVDSMVKHLNQHF